MGGRINEMQNGLEPMYFPPENKKDEVLCFMGIKVSRQSCQTNVIWGSRADQNKVTIPLLDIRQHEKR